MKPDRDDLIDELEHQRKMAKLLRQRIRALEIQQAQQGNTTPPQIVTEIATMAEQIARHEKEIVRLETLAAEGEVSLVEAEYRVILSEAWDTPRGRPTPANVAKLELMRMKMGLLPEKAHQIETEVRELLSEEAFCDLDIKFYEYLPKVWEDQNTQLEDTSIISEGVIPQEAWNQIASSSQSVVSGQSITIYNPFFAAKEDPYDNCLKTLGRAVRLNPFIALSLFLTVLPFDFKLDLEAFGIRLLAVNRVWNHRTDRSQFEQFLSALNIELEKRYDKRRA